MAESQNINFHINFLLYAYYIYHYISVFLTGNDNRIGYTRSSLFFSKTIGMQDAMYLPKKPKLFWTPKYVLMSNQDNKI